nr:AAA family ATPase [Pseudanabaena sp. FACHB-1998]
MTQSHVQLQDLTTASKLIESTLETFNLNYSPKLYIRLLDTFHEIAFAQGRYLQAFTTRQHQRSLEQQYGLRAFIGAGSLQPKQFSPNANITELDASKFDVNASEITASGRSQDVAQLLERILASEHQLTVIHGESGVGKSSLVNAGLIPALLQRSLTGLELLPIKIHIYTDWIKAIASELQDYTTNDADHPRSISALASLSALNNGSSNNSSNGSSNGSHNNGFSELRKGDPIILLHKFRQLASLGVHIVLIFDQFEEFFFTFTQAQERTVFINFWQSCLKIPSLKLVVSIREDYLHLLLDLEANQAEVDILSRNFRYAIGNLSPSDAKTLIENLTEHANFSLEEPLINELVRDLAGDRGSVRPIELQLVGSQLQDSNITTLAEYNLAGRKQRLVERSVEEVIQACGNAAFVAQQVMLLLTDEQGKRPLKTYMELRTGILPYSSNTEELDLVLEILIGSGLVFQLPEFPSKRYQLVHDYLVPFIRANQEAGLLEELTKVRSSAQRSQANLNRLTKIALVGTVVALFVMAGLAFQANRQRHLAESGEIEALISSAQSSFLLNRHLEALTTAIQSAKKLNAIDAGEDKTRITKLTFNALQDIIYNMRERYRFNPEKLDSPFYVAKFSPDGNTLAFGSYDGGVYLFQRNGKPISRLVGYKVKYVRSLSFSPDGKKLASVGKGKNVRIWDVQSGKLMGKFYAHSMDISKVSFHPNGKLLLTGSFDGSVKLWDSDRGIEIRTFNPQSRNVNSTDNSIKPQSIKLAKQVSDPIQDVSFSPDGKWIVIAKNTVISIWDLDGNLVADTIAHDNRILSVSFHPSGKMIASSGGDDTVKLWKIVELPTSTWRIELDKPYKGNPTDVLSLNFSSDGRHIAFGSQDNSIQVLNLDGTIEMKLGGHTGGVFDVSFSPDGRYLISASKDRTVRLWDLKTTLIDTVYGHTDTVWSVSFRPDGQVFASGSVDKTVRIWNTDGTLKQELLGHEGIVYGVSYSPDGKKLVSSSTDKTVRVWDAETGKLLNLLNIHGAELIYATFSPDQKILATLGNDNKIKLWQWDDTNSPKLLQVLEGHTKEVWGISFSPDNRFIASTSNDQTVKVWNVNNGQNVMTMESAHVNGGLAIAYSRDGKLIGSAGKDGKLKLWNAQTGILEKEISSEDGSWIYGLNFSPDGKAIATATADKKIKIIDLATGETVKTLSGHTAEVNSVTYSPNGKVLISASRDNTLKVWNAETLTFNELVERGCNLLENYLLYTPTVKPEQKQICKP